MFIPHTPDDVRQMLDRLGMQSLDDLFASIPGPLRFQGELPLPAALTEIELTRHLGELAARNRSGEQFVSFLGAGCYDHFIPAVVDAIAGRSEYYTAYTPYQPEVSQGTLQVGFEFQSLICELTGLDVSNASLYEGATAVVEAALMAMAATGRSKKLVVSEAVHPEYRQTLETYATNLPFEVETIPAPAGVTDPDLVARAVDSATAAVIAQSPNFFGAIEPVAEIAAIAKEAGALAVQSFDPISLGILKRPGEMGVDVAVAEGQSLGTPPSYGGPFLGLFACRQDFLRRMPGRVVGETVDRLGRRCFVLTLQTREQHIRREKATSNICTNQGLMALKASVYLALLGPQGLKEVAELCWNKAHYAADRLAELRGVTLPCAEPFFKEFVVRLPIPANRAVERLADKGFHAGVSLERWFDDRPHDLLVAVTENRTKEEIDRFVEAMASVIDE